MNNKHPIMIQPIKNVYIPDSEKRIFKPNEDVRYSLEHSQSVVVQRNGRIDAIQSVKEQKDSYVLSKLELEKIIVDAFGAGSEKGADVIKSTYSGTSSQVNGLNEYLKSILP